MLAPNGGLMRLRVIAFFVEYCQQFNGLYQDETSAMSLMHYDEEGIGLEIMSRLFSEHTFLSAHQSELVPMLSHPLHDGFCNIMHYLPWSQKGLTF